MSAAELIADLKSRVEYLRSTGYGVADRKLLDRAITEIDRLTAELEAMRKDAERYRWLRDKANYSYKSAPCVVSGAMPSGDLTMLIEAELDVAIDKVIIARKTASPQPAPVLADVWVSCKERLPELDEPVLAWLNETLCALVRFDDGDGWLWAMCDGWPFINQKGEWDCGSNCDDEYLPTHWQSLPAAPEAK